MVRKTKKYLKHLLYFAIYYSGLLHIIVGAFKRIKSEYAGIILFYHRFSKTPEKQILPYHDINEFEKQILYLRKYYKIVDMNEVAHVLNNNSKFTRPCIVITIDDGYLDNYTLAYPILKKYDISATIYVTSGLVGTNSGLWLDDIAYALEHAKVRKLYLRELFGDEVLDISTNQEKKNAMHKLYCSLLNKNNSGRQDLIQKLFELLKVEKSILNRERLMLNWDEITEMSMNGITLGAHTLSHPSLPALSPESARQEIKYSREIIENKLVKPVVHFAIPNGRKDDFTDDLREFCRAESFHTVVTTEMGLVGLSSDRFALPRLLPPSPLYYFACEIARYFIFGAGKKL
jgi:peptidoglycan/xylan/chitin deacetylase (PgdA/CDA1 family)